MDAVRVAVTTFTFRVKGHSSLVMGKQKSPNTIKPRGAASAVKKKNKGVEDVEQRGSHFPVAVSIVILVVAILAGLLYLLLLPSLPRGGGTYQTPYSVTGNVTVKTLPSPSSDFAHVAAKFGAPLVLRNSVVQQWKAADLWTPEYLQSKLRRLSGVYENTNKWFGPYFDPSKPLTSFAVRVNNYKTDVSLTSAEFFKRIQNPVKGRHLYFTGGIEQMGSWAEEHIQPLGELLTLNPKRSSINVWMGQPHVIAHCHYDGYHNFYAQLYGTKKFTLFRPTNWPGLYPYPFLHPSHAQAQVNMSERSEVEELYPLVGSVEAIEVTLEPGDLLYMPPLWFHQVESMDTSISVNVWTDSKQTEMVEKMFSVPLPLNDGSLRWKTAKGRAIATVLLIYRLLEGICHYQTCTDIHTDKFVENSIDAAKEQLLSDKVLYFVHRLWSTRYRILMEKGQLPSQLDDEGSILCESVLTEGDREAVGEAERVLEGMKFGAYVIEIAQLVRALPRDTWELWVGNFVEYIIVASSSVEDVGYVGLYLSQFSSCIVGKYIDS